MWKKHHKCLFFHPLEKKYVFDTKKLWKIHKFCHYMPFFISIVEEKKYLCINAEKFLSIAENKDQKKSSFLFFLFLQHVWNGDKFSRSFSFFMARNRIQFCCWMDFFFLKFFFSSFFGGENSRKQWGKEKLSLYHFLNWSIAILTLYRVVMGIKVLKWFLEGILLRWQVKDEL